MSEKEERRPESIVDAIACIDMLWRNPDDTETKPVKAGDKVKIRVRQLAQFSGSTSIDGIPGARPRVLEDAKQAAEAVKAYKSQRREIVLDPAGKPAA
jgi:hypothetical protein